MFIGADSPFYGHSSRAGGREVAYGPGVAAGAERGGAPSPRHGHPAVAAAGGKRRPDRCRFESFESYYRSSVMISHSGPLRGPRWSKYQGSLPSFSRYLLCL